MMKVRRYQLLDVYLSLTKKGNVVNINAFPMLNV
jgi:hypothetical protein